MTGDVRGKEKGKEYWENGGKGEERIGELEEERLARGEETREMAD